MTRNWLGCAAALAALLAFITTASPEVRITYPQVRVQLGPTYTPDADFDTFRKKFLSAIESKNLLALSELVAPGFVWTVDSALAVDFDPGRDAQHNFRVVFGFRGVGEVADGDVENGDWNLLKSFAEDDSLNQVGDGENLVCSPNAATIVSTEVYERAAARVDEAIDDVQWFFTLRATAVAKAPDDTGTPIGKISIEAVPVLSTHPQDADKPTHLEILLPSGRRGWIPANVARPLQGDRLCYVRNVGREWRIGIFDAAEVNPQ
jgi:hypothetical protein